MNLCQDSPTGRKQGGLDCFLAFIQGGIERQVQRYEAQVSTEADSR